MKKYYLVAAALVMLAAGCTKEIEQVSDETTYITRTYTAGIGTDTKTAVDEAGKVSWKAGDVVRYYSAKNGAIGECAVAEDGASAPLSMDVASDASFLIALYGGTSVTSNTSGNAFTLNGAVKAEQTGKFEDAHVAVVKTYDVAQPTLTFTNVTSLVMFTLERTDVSYISFASNDGTAIHGNGELNFTFSDETPSAALGSTAGNSIKVTVGAAGTYYISTLPTTLAKGFTIKCYDSSDKYLGMVKSEKEVSVEKNTVLNLGTIDSRIVAPYDPVYEPNLSKNGTANCYIIPVEGEYYFDATVKGSSTEKIAGTTAKAYTLWESFGTSTAPSTGDIVKDVKYENGKVYFTATGKNGNAVIAIENRDEEIQWSWHIWCCMDYDADFYAQVYNNNAGTMMDRNLGATSATPGDVHALGLLYQWGRKDPFLGGNSISYSSSSNQSKAASTINWPSAVSSDATNGTIEYATANPTTFINYNTSNYDWYYTGSSTTDKTRWQTSGSTKGLYDPCPTGYRVPDGGSAGVWSKAFDTSRNWETSSNWDSTNKGMDFGSTDKTLGTGTIWYPASGYLSSSRGVLSRVGDYGYYWSCSPNGSSAYYLYFNYGGSVFPSYDNYRALGQSVRCCKE